MDKQYFENEHAWNTYWEKNDKSGKQPKWNGGPEKYPCIAVFKWLDGILPDDYEFVYLDDFYN